jgi:c-di-GMP-binding flagellar brake protein YcgR
MSRPPSQHRRIIERRKHPRILTPSSALLSFKRYIDPFQSEDRAEGDGRLIELSLGGCGLLNDIPLEIGKRYHLILQVSKKSYPIIVEAAVVQWIQENIFGLKFSSMQAIHESQLRELLIELRRPAP